MWGIFYCKFKKFCAIIISKMGKIARYLNQLTIGNTFDSPEILELYATDRSVLKIKPKAVSLPESTEDVRKLMRFVNQLSEKGIKLPVTVWGSGLDETGAGLSNGLIVSMEKMNKLLESDKRERLVRVQAGITLKELNTALSINGLTLPVGGHENDTIGSLISNCPSDVYAGKYGSITHFIERIEVVLPTGDAIQTDYLSARSVERIAQEKTSEGAIYKKLSALYKKNEKLIDEIRKNKNETRGYAKVGMALRKKSFDLMPLYFGAQGTLGIITEVILRAVPIESKTGRVVATFEKYETAKSFMDTMKPLQPLELNFYDIKVAKAAEESGKKLGINTDKYEEGGFVVFVKFDKRLNTRLNKVSNMKKTLPRNAQVIVESQKNQKMLDEFENSLTSYLNQVKAGERVPLATNFYLPAEKLGQFLEDLKVIEKSLKLDLALYGSYAAECYNLRPKFDVEDAKFLKNAVAFIRAANFIINREGGSISGGAPEGRVKALVSNMNLSEDEKNLYTAIKDIFDPQGIMNPGVKLGADPRFTLAHFRTTGSGKTVL